MCCFPVAIHLAATIRFLPISLPGNKSPGKSDIGLKRDAFMMDIERLMLGK